MSDPVVYQVAIDGPAASGKSTTARAVAGGLGIQYLDTGAMYRAFTLRVLEAGVHPKDAPAVDSLLDGFELNLEGGRILLEGRDVSAEIRENRISTLMGPVCVMPAVRRRMVSLQREFGSRRSSVIDGRDIGTVVFPEARFKFFLVADLEERARRRMAELGRSGERMELRELMEEIRRRDERDASRDISPMKCADDAVRLDTTKLSFDEQVRRILEHVRRGLGEDA